LERAAMYWFVMGTYLEINVKFVYSYAVLCCMLLYFLLS